MNMIVEISEPRNFTNFWKQPSDKIEGAVNIGLFRIGHKIADKAKNLAPKLSGTLQRSITVDPQLFTNVQGKIAVGSNVVYARIHDLGGTITAKTKKALRFKTKSGKWVTVKKVNIKKYKGRGYLTPAFVWASRSIVKQILDEEINDVMK